MSLIENDDNEELEFNVEDLFKDPDETDNEEPEDKPVAAPETKAVSKRINEVRSKTEADTQDRVAKELGYESYAALKAAQERKLIDDAGLDPEDVSDVVEKLIAKRLAEDPRIKKLEEYEAREKQQFVKSQLDDINKLTGQKFTSIEQLPKETLEMWQKTGNLKQAYLATQGEELLGKSTKRSENGTLLHLADNGGSNVNTKTRGLTEEEKNIWRSIMPDITEEELSKKTTNI